jgi:predicted permease
LAAGGGAGGLLLSFWIKRTLLAYLNAGRSAAAALVVTTDMRVLAFCVALSFGTVIIFGLIPARQATRIDLVPGLTEAAGNDAGFRGAWMRRSLVVLQIALSLTVVFAAGLLTRTLRSLQTADLGFNPDHVIALKVDPEAAGHSGAEVSRIFDEILERVRAYQGIAAACLAASTPNGSQAISMNVDVPGYVPNGPGDDISDFNFVSPAYFKTLGQPLLEGRDFRDQDDQNGPRVAIVNRKFVHKYWHDQEVIGRKFRQGGGELEVVGIVGDARDRGIKRDAQDAVYLPVKQSQTAGLTVLVRTANEPGTVIPSLVAIVRSIDRRIPVSSVLTLETQISSSLSSERILSYLSALFGALSTLLSGIGLYGVLSYSVTRRTREIGVRYAVGAQAGDIAGMFVRETVLLLMLGLVLGAPFALLSVQVFKNLLFGVSSTDWATLCFSAGVLTLAIVLAVALPLRRAARVNPLVALRYE